MKFRTFLAVGLVAICTSATSRAQWNVDAWPSCDHSGKTFMDDGIMYRQVWAGDMFNALSERASVLYTNGWAGLTGGVSTNWWRSYTGVTNRVVRNEREVLAFFRAKTAAMLDQYVDPTVTNIVDHVNDGWFTQEITIEHTYANGCVSGAIQSVTADLSYDRYYSRTETNTALKTSYATVRNVKLHKSDHDHGSNYCAAAQVPFYFFEQDVLDGGTASYLTPNRLRGGLCFSVTNMPSYEVFVPTVAEVDPIAEVVAISSSNSADIDVALDLTSTNLPYIASSNLFYDIEILEDGTTQYAGTNVWYDMSYTATIGIGITNSSAFIASNVIVGVSVSEELEVEVISGDFPGLNWSNWKRKPVTFKAKTMTPGQVVEFTLLVRFNRNPGESPRSNEKWYYPDYGWDGLRRVVNTMDKTVWSDYEWYWTGSSDNAVEGYYPLDPDESWTNAWDTAKTLAVANEATSIDRTASPSMISNGYYGREDDCDTFRANYQYIKNKASVTNLEAYVYAPSFVANIYVEETLKGTVFDIITGIELKFVESHSGSASFIGSVAVGPSTPEWCTDPKETPGDNEVGTNHTELWRSYSDPYVVIEWDFLYND